MSIFSSARLRVARKRRGLTKLSLAEALGVSVRTVVRWEQGASLPSSGQAAALAQLLLFPEGFFFVTRALDELSCERVSFRALRRMSASLRDRALAVASLAIDVDTIIRSRFRLPSPAIPNATSGNPEAEAEAVRAELGLADRPVENMVALLETIGIRVYSLVEECRELDAFCVVSDGVPFVLLNTVSSGERGRFDSAHELGHLVLHASANLTGKNAEIEANRFAGAFLMPRCSVLAARITNPTPDALLDHKLRWGVSAVALNQRLFEINAISEWTYRQNLKDMSERGWRSSGEVSGVAREKSRILEKIFKWLRSQGISPSALAQESDIGSFDFEQMVFGLATIGLDTESITAVSTRPRGQLRLLNSAS